MLKDGCWGSGGKRFASYSEGVVDTLCGYVEGVDKFFDHPIQTTCNAVGQLILDPAKPIREMSVNMALAIHNRDWDSVAYQVGGLTTHTAVIGTTYMATSGIPSSINVKIPKISTAALTNGKTALVVSTTTARVSTAGAVSIGEAAVGVNIMYNKYTAPKGGGGITDSINVNGREVTFGHGGRHLEGTGLTPEQVNSAIANNLPVLKPGEFYKGTVNINGISIEYTSYGRTEGIVHVGTYYPK